MSHASDFGTVNIQRPQPSTAGAFWATAPRKDFTRLCLIQYYDHMIGSSGDRTVSGAVVVGYLEETEGRAIDGEVRDWPVGGLASRNEHRCS